MIDILVSNEPERECGFRTPGADGVGVYLMGDGLWQYCERLPFPLHVCPTCSHGIKHSKGWTNVQPSALFAKSVEPRCTAGELDGRPDREHFHWACSMCTPPEGAHGLLWVGKQFYSPQSFIKEAVQRGVSKKLSGVPKGMVFGETIVYLAHIEAVVEKVEFGEDPELSAGVFMTFKPSHVDLVVESIDDIPEKAYNISDNVGEENVRIVQVRRVKSAQAELPSEGESVSSPAHA